MAKILYANVRERASVRGHIYFDSQWVNQLSNLYDVDLLCLQENWYKDISNDVNQIVYEPEQHIRLRKLWKSKIFQQGILSHLSLYEHNISRAIFNYICKLDKINNYDYIIFSTFDVMNLSVNYGKISNPKKIFLIEHKIDIYNQKALRVFFDLYKNKVNHIVMEKDGIDYLKENYSIDKNLIHYIPHPLNVVREEKKDDLINYDVVGISNSNSEDDIQKIIDMEIRDKFFESNKIKVLLRTKSIEYEDKWLKIIAGNVNLTFQEYYTYIVNSGVVILPFDISFGLRSSGTIIDAFSNHVPIIGTDFSTMRQYNKEYKEICRIYHSVDELKSLILDMVQVKTEKMNGCFEKFIEDRSDMGMQKYIKNTFNEKHI